MMKKLLQKAVLGLVRKLLLTQKVHLKLKRMPTMIRVLNLNIAKNIVVNSKNVDKKNLRKDK